MPRGVLSKSLSLTRGKPEEMDVILGRYRGARESLKAVYAVAATPGGYFTAKRRP